VPAKESQKPLDPMWTTFRQLYLDASGRIVDNGNGGISHSEAGLWHVAGHAGR
jgi:endoglucanase